LTCNLSDYLSTRTSRYSAIFTCFEAVSINFCLPKFSACLGLGQVPPFSTSNAVYDRPYSVSHRKNIAELPDCPPDLSEPQYASLMFEHNCQVGLFYVFELRRQTGLRKVSCSEDRLLVEGQVLWSVFQRKVSLLHARVFSI
jgi:hypothetical protein